MKAFNAGKFGAQLKKDFYIRHFKECDSTNNRAKQYVRQNPSCGEAVFVADYQTAGRGRQGRDFASPKGTGLYMSVVFSVETEKLASALITPAAAVAVCETLNSLYCIESTIKWVNDIYCGGRKICGILTEVGSPNDDGICRVVLGIGINIKHAAALDTVGNAAAVSDFSEVDLPRDKIAAEIVNAFFAMLEAEDIIERYKAKNHLIGQKIVFAVGDEGYEGVAKDINGSGNLVVDCAGKEMTLGSNDISVRPKPQT